MPSVVIAKSNTPFPFIDATKAKEYEQFRAYLDTSLSQSLTAAFVVIKNDSLIYEHYFNGFNQQSLLPSFSVAKSFVGTLVSIAVNDGKIKSLQDPITNYLPELYKKDQRFSRITLQHLLDMKSGLYFKEGDYNIKDDAIKLAFRPHLLKHALKVKIEKEPGGTFNYQSINTELLALALERATGKKISAYLQEKLWQPLGAESDATWNVDSRKRKQEIAFAGLNATARDFARLGVLYLHKGNFKDQQILDPSWIQTLASADSMTRANGYKNQWWSRLDYNYFEDSLAAVAFKNATHHTSTVQKADTRYRVGYRSGAFHAQGMLNQYIYVNPKNNVVIVRLGRFWHHPKFRPAQFIYHVGQQL
jgi:CubicO group peptidase (beta-lactamase class C family)